MRRTMNRSSTGARGRIDEKRTEIYYWWLLVAIFFEYARPSSFLHGIAVLKLNSLIPLSLLAATMVAQGLRSWGELYSDRGSRWMTAFICLMFISIPFAAVKSYALDKFLGVLGYFFLFLIVARVATSVRRLYGIFGVLIVSHLFLITMSPEVVLNSQTRSYIQGATFLGDGNDFALSVCILIPMAIALAQRARSRWSKLFAWGALIVLLMGLMGTQSRGAALGIVAVVGLLWTTSKRKLRFTAIILAASGAVALYASDAYFARLGTLRHATDDQSAEGRIIAWKASLRMAADNPLLGVGLGNFPTECGSKYRPKDRAMPWMTAHSTYFLVLGELGPPGLVVLLALVIGAIPATLGTKRRLLESGSDPPSSEVSEMARVLNLLAASAIGFAVAGAFLSAAYYPHIYVLGGILVSARCIARGMQPDAAVAAGQSSRGRGRLSGRGLRRGDVALEQS